LGGVQAQGDLLLQDTVEARSIETKTRVLISYSRKDMAFADKLEAVLKARGFEVLIDREEIYAFEDWWKRIEALIGHFGRAARRRQLEKRKHSLRRAEKRRRRQGAGATS